MGGWVYILTNRPNGTLYIGVTADLIKPVWQHRDGIKGGFTSQHGLHQARLILESNSGWVGLYPTLL